MGGAHIASTKYLGQDRHRFRRTEGDVVSGAVLAPREARRVGHHASELLAADLTGEQRTKPRRIDPTLQPDLTRKRADPFRVRLAFLPGVVVVLGEVPGGCAGRGHDAHADHRPARQAELVGAFSCVSVNWASEGSSFATLGTSECASSRRVITASIQCRRSKSSRRSPSGATMRLWNPVLPAGTSPRAAHRPIFTRKRERFGVGAWALRVTVLDRIEQCERNRTQARLDHWT